MPKVQAGPRKRNSRQGDFFASMPALRTQVISSRKDFDALFDGFTKMQAISYVTSKELLEEFFNKREYTDVELVVGESLTSQSLRQELEQSGVELTERLAELVDKGALRIYVPDRTIHTKLYILEGTGSTRIIQTSANFTETARQASHQVNYAWYADLPEDDPFLRQVSQDYRSHLKGCSPFMGDLMELLRERKDMDKRQVIEIWLKGVSVVEKGDLEVKRTLQEVSFNSLRHTRLQEEPMITVQLPETPRARKQVERLLAPLNAQSFGSEMRVNGPAYIRYVQENHRVPLLRVDTERQEVLLGINGAVLTLTGPLPDSTLVDEALGHIEAYLQTVDRGQTLDSKFAKMSMFEALLYMLFSPFANEFMKVKRATRGLVNWRGPRFLYIYGPSQNGKSTFLRFALKLLARHQIMPLHGGDFTKSKIQSTASLGTAFPLVFDDVDVSKHEDVIKSYWESWWQEDCTSPQIIVSSNKAKLKDWAKSRVKRVDFDVHFDQSAANEVRLQELLSFDNDLFKWFSYLYLRHVENGEPQSDDELQSARVVMKELYEHARRPRPDFFPTEPIENLYDPGRRDWRDLLHGGLKEKVKVTREKGRILINFSKDMQFWEISDYDSCLPPTVKHARKGSTVIIESPSVFDTWLEGRVLPRRSLLDRIKRGLK